MLARTAVVALAVAACTPPPPRDTPLESKIAPPAPLFEIDPIMGGLPTPPRQGQPANIVRGKLPAVVATTAKALFEIGLADPRDCEYREIELAVGNVWRGDGGTVSTRGWVMPARDRGKTWAVAWNGLVYPVVAAGKAASVRADVEAMIARAGGPPGERGSEARGVSHTTAGPIKVLLLLQLGEPALAHALWQAADLDRLHADDRDPYLALAQIWIWDGFERAVTAHMRGDDFVAFASGRSVRRAIEPVEREAARRGFERRDGTYLPFLAPLAALIDDSERRVLAKPRAPLPPRDQLARLDAPTRVLLLVAHLDEVRVHQDSQPGSVTLAADPIVEDLIATGELAVEPLLAVLEHDTRLTRSVHFHRDFGRHRSPLGVHDAAMAALEVILQQPFFEPASTSDDLSGRGLAGRRQVAAAIRAHWAKWRGVPVDQRWFATLADDARPDAWLEAAASLATPSAQPIGRGSVFGTRVAATRPVLRGDAMRARRLPSVGDLIEKRLADPRVDGEAACELARIFARWDAVAARPAMFTQLGRAIADSGTTHTRARCISRLVPDLVDAGSLAALDLYATWITATQPPFELEPLAFQPLWQYAEHPVIARASEQLFAAGSPWLPLVSTKSEDYAERHKLLRLELIATAGFNRHVLAMLADPSVVGTGQPSPGDRHHRITLAHGSTTIDSTDEPIGGASFAIRRSDWYARTLAVRHRAAPRFELHWPQARRDAALAQMRAWVQTRVKLPAAP